MAVDLNTSDLFFNLDHDEANEYSRNGEFDGYNDEKLLAQASWFCAAISAISPLVYSPQEIVEDFKRRV